MDNKLALKLGRIGTAVLRLFPAEFAHEMGIKILAGDLINKMPKPSFTVAPVGLHVDVPHLGPLTHPIGLAAGFDKNCHAPQGFAHLGLSYLEIGTITPRPQAGNPKPRIFRFPEQHAIINRMGFNNDGALAIAKRLQSHKWQGTKVPIGINLGKNKDTPNAQAIDDYINSYSQFRGMGDYYVINISSPNTPGLRELASKEFIQLLGTTFASEGQKVWVKLDPDMDKARFQEIIEALVENGFPGVILSNTHRVERPEVGGQSGHPLAIPSTRCLEWAWEVHRGQLPMIGVGGIMSGLDAYEKIIRGANAIQIYAALVYRGPWAVYEILAELANELELRGIKNINDAFGLYYN